MSRLALIRALGLIGAIVTAAALGLSGQYVEAAGVVSSALASSSVIVPKE